MPHHENEENGCSRIIDLTLLLLLLLLLLLFLPLRSNNSVPEPAH
jgi:hypothetical protein